MSERGRAYDLAGPVMTARTFDVILCRVRSAAFAAVAVVAVALFAPTYAHAARDDCVFLRTVSNFKVIDNQTVIVYASSFEAYRVDLFGHCIGLRSAEAIAIDSRDGRLCWPSQNHIKILGDITSVGQRCLVDKVTKLGRGRDAIRAAIAEIEEERKQVRAARRAEADGPDAE